MTKSIPNLASIMLSHNNDAINVELSQIIKNELIKNVKYFPVIGVFSMFEHITGPSCDTVSYFQHDNDERYCVVHTIFGYDFKQIYEHKINNATWVASISSTAFKKDCIKDYIITNDCIINELICIMND